MQGESAIAERGTSLRSRRRFRHAADFSARRCILGVILPLLAATAAAAQDQIDPIFTRLTQLKTDPGSLTGDQAVKTTKEFLIFADKQARKENTILFQKLRNVKKKYIKQWDADMQKVENRLMLKVRDAIIECRTQAVREAAGGRRLNTVFGYSDSGKWPLKQPSELKFDGDFDWTLFALDPRHCNPSGQTGIIPRFKELILGKLGVAAPRMDIIANGLGFEADAGVYITSGGRKWALKEMKNFSYIDPVSKKTIYITNFNHINPLTGTPFKRPGQAIFVYTQLAALRQQCPALFQPNGRLKPGLSLETIGKLLAARYGQESLFTKLFVQGQTYTRHDAAVAPVDLACHFHESAAAATPEEEIAKAIKILARSTDVFNGGMKGINYREHFSAEEWNLMKNAFQAEYCKNQQLEFNKQAVKFLTKFDAGEVVTIMNDAQLAEYAAIQNKAKAFKNQHAESFQKVAGQGKVTKQAAQRLRRDGIKLLLKQSEFASGHRRIEVLDLDSRNRRGQAFKQWLSEIELVIKTNGEHMSPEFRARVTQHRDALKVMVEANAKTPEGFLGIIRVKGKNVVKLSMSQSLELLRKTYRAHRVLCHQDVRNLLNKTDLGQHLVKKIPKWIFELQIPHGLDTIDVGPSASFMAELIKPVEGTVTALMMVDMALQFSDIWYSEQPWHKKMWSLGTTVAVIVLPHAYLVPAVYHASLTGDPDELAWVFTCHLCPVAMLPQLIKSFGMRFGAQSHLAWFDAELNQMYLASVFEPNQPNKEWTRNPQQAKFTWQYMQAVGDVYERTGAFGKEADGGSTPRLAEYFRRLFIKDPSEVALVAQQRPGEADEAAGTRRLGLSGTASGAIRYMIEHGDHRLFRENQALANATGELRDFTGRKLSPFMFRPPAYSPYSSTEKKFRNPEYLAKIDLLNNALAAGEDKRLERAVVTVVKALLVERGELQNNVYELLADSIIRSFEDRRLAIFLEASKALQPLLDELEKIGEDLHVKDQLVDLVRQDIEVALAEAPDLGANAGIQGTIVLKWLRGYRSVRDVRNLVVPSGVVYGLDAAFLTGPNGPLSSSPCLRLDPYDDVTMAGKAHTDFAGIKPDVQSVLQTLKGTPPELTGADEENYRKLAAIRYRAMILEYWFRGKNGAVPLVWSDVAEPISDDVFAEKIVAKVEELLHKPSDGWPNSTLGKLGKLASGVAGQADGRRYKPAADPDVTYGGKLADLRKTATEYNQLVNKLRLEYALRVEWEPKTLILRQGKSKTLTLKPLHPKAQLKWSIKRIDNALISATSPNGVLADGKEQEIIIKADQDVGDETKKTTLGIKLLYDILRQHPEITIDPSLVSTTIEIPVVINPPETTTVTVHLYRQIRDEKTTDPVPDAKVVLKGPDLEKALTGQSPGMYRLAEVMPENYTLDVSAPGFNLVQGQDLKVRIPLPEPDARPEPVKKTIYLAPKQGQIVAKVVGATDGMEAPLSDARVQLTALSDVKTDHQGFKNVGDDGTRTFENLLPGQYKLTAKADYYKGPVDSEPITLDTKNLQNSTPQPIRITLRPILSDVAVIVQNIKKEPMSGVLVGLAGAYQNTGANGKAVFRDVLPSPVNTPYQVTAALEGYPAVTKSKKVLPETEGDPIPDVLITLQGGSINVTVVDGDTGKPLTAAAVQLRGARQQFADLDDQGRCAFIDLPESDYILDATLDGYLIQAQQTVHVGGSSAQDFQKAVVLKLFEGIKLKVFVHPKSAPRTAKGEPAELIAAARISLDGNTKYAGSGAFLFPRVTTKNNHTITASAQGFGEATLNNVAFTKDEMKKGIAYRYIPLEPGVTLRVEIRQATPSGVFVEGPCKLSIKGPNLSKTLTGVEKFKDFQKLEAGQYQVTASAEGYAPGNANLTIRYEDKKLAYILPVRLKPLLATLVVSVTPPTVPQGEKSPKINVSANGPAGSLFATGTKATFSKLAKGKYNVSASATGYPTASKTVNIAPSEPNEVFNVKLSLTSDAPQPEPMNEDLQALINSLFADMENEEAEIVALTNLFLKGTIDKDKLKTELTKLLGKKAADHEVDIILKIAKLVKAGGPTGEDKDDKDKTGGTPDGDTGGEKDTKGGKVVAGNLKNVKAGDRTPGGKIIKEKIYHHKNGNKSEHYTYYDLTTGETLRMKLLTSEAKHGMRTTWYENGKKYEEEIYKDGRKEGPYTSWNENGKKWKDGNYKNDKMNGLWTEWMPDGWKWSIQQFVDGDRHGTYVHYHKNGKPARKENYVKGAINGTVETYHENGKKASEETYVMGAKRGAFKSWWSNGRVATVGNFPKKRTSYNANGQLAGYRYWDEKGTTTRTVEYLYASGNKPWIIKDTKYANGRPYKRIVDRFEGGKKYRTVENLK